MIAGMHFPGFLRRGRAGAARPCAAAAVLSMLLAGGGLFRPATPPAAPPVRHVEAPNDTGLPASAARALSQRFPTMHAIGHSAGHLQVDDADDLAVVLAPAGQSHDAVVAVLVTGPGGEY